MCPETVNLLHWEKHMLPILLPVGTVTVDDVFPWSLRGLVLRIPEILMQAFALPLKFLW